jgi:hypothetical protein
MRNILFITFFWAAISVVAQNQDKGIGAVSLNPFISNEEIMGQKTESMLMSKLNQIATFGGMSGSGFDNRFVITPHIQELEASQTATFPQKTAVHLSVGIYIGDGTDGTLFSSYVMEVKGIGDDKDDAYASALKKIRPNTPELQEQVLIGKKRILQYYNLISSNIINSAKAAAQSGKYDEALNMLFSIPLSCKDFDAAQSLIGRYGNISLEKTNQLLVDEARAAWSASPNEDGAENARKIMGKITTPSAEITSKVNTLSKEMAQRLKSVKDREMKLEEQEVQNRKDIALADIKKEKAIGVATVNAAASVARAYASSRPKIVYHIHWW